MLRHVRFRGRSFLGSFFQSFRSSSLEKFIQQENANYDRLAAQTRRFRDKLHAEAVSMLIPEGISPPEFQKGYFYYNRYSDEGFTRFCRVPADSAGKAMDIEKDSPLEETILDVCDVSGRFSLNNFADVSAAKITIDNSLLGFVADVRGDEKWSLMFRDLINHDYISHKIPLARNFEWIDNTITPGRFCYYTEMDPVTLRSVAVRRLSLDSKSSVPIWKISDSGSYIDLFKSKDGKCIFMSSSSKTQSEVYVVPSDDPTAQPVLIRPPQKGVEYYCENRDGFIYIVSNKDFVNFALYRVPMDKVGQDWQLVYHSPDMTITDIDMFRRGIVLYGSGFEGEPGVEVLRFKKFANPSTLSDDFQGDLETEFGIVDKVKIPFKGSYSIGKLEVGVNGDFDAEKCRFTFRSPKNPGTCLELDFANRRLEAIKSREFQHNAQVGMSMERVLVNGQIPLTLVAPEKFLRPNSPRPCLVFVYGAYGQNLEPDFSPAITSLVDRGWIVAFAHVRGGGEKGPEWHQSGSRMNRQNGVDDLKTCCEWLVGERITDPKYLCAVGASAGGVVLGAALNQFGKSLIGGAAILRVPFVDVLNTLRNRSLPLSSHEKDEWGDVDDQEQLEFIQSICPRRNISDIPDWYPPMLITCAEDDSRVPFQGVIEYAQLLRDRIQGEDELVLKTNRAGEGGHFGTASAAGNYHDTCMELAFLFRSVDCALE